ncbi:SRPBCC family protein [Amycolatopsis nigrescens]|uniref:SRPBCC family protein n=1 Tax=Amycolatopsis nigrescens TaxID=381445 RepID=UPI0003800135|nr:SRPBCC domain-containing protein [Amycolatopsis nigrescens]
MTELLQLRARLAATPPAVYSALTEATALTTWLAEYADISLPQRRFEFWGRYTPQGARGRQRLLEAERDRLLKFAWTLDGKATTAEIRLAPDGRDGTELTVVQDGAPTLEELMAPTGRRDGLHSLHTFWGLAIAGLAEYVEGRELTPKCDFGPDRAAEIRIEVTVGAPADEVFESLIDPVRIGRWFGWEAEVEPRLGGRMTLGADGRIFEFEPGRKLAYGDGEMVVRWELAESGGGTRLTFVQSGFEPGELDNAAQHEAGWLAGIAELKRMHELGERWQPLTTELPADPER